MCIRDRNKLADSECDVIVLGGGEEIIDQFPQAGEMVVTRQKIFLLTDTYQLTMPDMNGWTRKEVSGFWKASGLPVKLCLLYTSTDQSRASRTQNSRGCDF